MCRRNSETLVKITQKLNTCLNQPDLSFSSRKQKVVGVLQCFQTSLSPQIETAPEGGTSCGESRRTQLVLLGKGNNSICALER